jgi:hypothetical protein
MAEELLEVGDLEKMMDSAPEDFRESLEEFIGMPSKAGMLRMMQDLTKENLALRSLLEEHQAIIEKLRAKLVEQDTVIGQLAGRNSKGN